MKIIAGWNRAGYLPDADPEEFETIEDAKASLIDDLLTMAEDEYDDVARHVGLTHLAEDVNLISDHATTTQEFSQDGIEAWIRVEA